VRRSDPSEQQSAQRGSNEDRRTARHGARTLAEFAERKFATVQSLRTSSHGFRGRRAPRNGVCLQRHTPQTGPSAPVGPSNPVVAAPAIGVEGSCGVFHQGGLAEKQICAIICLNVSRKKTCLSGGSFLFEQLRILFACLLESPPDGPAAAYGYAGAGRAHPR
jgi:hypothetical protein